MKALFFTLLILTSKYALAQDILARHCEKLGGEMVNTFTCPKSGLKLNWNFCLSRSSQGDLLFSDGCTGPSGGHSELFYPACIKHDYCYHHEPITSGMTRRDCDDEFLETTLELCQKAPHPETCQYWAKGMYAAVRGFGELAFNCAEYEANYRESFFFSRR